MGLPAKTWLVCTLIMQHFVCAVIVDSASKEVLNRKG